MGYQVSCAENVLSLITSYLEIFGAGFDKSWSKGNVMTEREYKLVATSSRTLGGIIRLKSSATKLYTPALCSIPQLYS